MELYDGLALMSIQCSDVEICSIVLGVKYCLTYADPGLNGAEYIWGKLKDPLKL